MKEAGVLYVLPNSSSGYFLKQSGTRIFTVKVYNTCNELGSMNCILSRLYKISVCCILGKLFDNNKIVIRCLSVCLCFRSPITGKIMDRARYNSFSERGRLSVASNYSMSTSMDLTYRDYL